VGALPPAGALPLHPAKGFCPLETQSGALPPTPPQGPLALDPLAGLCPAPQLGALPPNTPTRGLCPLDSQSGALPPTPPQGPLALDPSPGNPEGFPGCSFWRSLIVLICLYRSNQGAFRSPPGPLRSAPLLTVLSKQRRKNRSSNLQANTPPSGGSPKVSKGRSESPLVAREGETPPRTKTFLQRKIPQTKHPPSPSGLGVMGQGSKTLAGCRGGGPAGVWGGAPQKGCRGRAPAGVWGGAPQKGCRGRRPRPGSRGSAPDGIPKGKALW